MFNEFVEASATGDLREWPLQPGDDEHVSSTPRELILHPVYPNPFRLDDSTALHAGVRIQYDVPENAAVSIAIYDMAGQTMRLIAATLNTGGRHFLIWEGLNDTGFAVSSGLYLVKIEAAGESGRMYQATQKVTVVR